jgi:uncharacterized phage protein (TIGR02218 family)
MTKAWGAALKAHHALGSTTLATCWKATLTNGTVVTATALDRDIPNLPYDGRTYLSVAAYTPSDVESASNLAPDNLELEGFLASPHITDADIHSGIWDYAKIEIFNVNYKDLTQGRDRLREGTLGEVRAGRASFRAELRGLTQHYSLTFIRVIQKECPWDLGSTKPKAFCGVNLVPITVTGTVDSAVNNREIIDAARTEALDWFTGGKLTFTSGLNNGLSMEVKYSTAGLLELHEAMPFAIVAGDVYSVYAGCLKRKIQDCRDKHNNVLNFGGFSYLPGQRVYAGPQE